MRRWFGTLASLRGMALPVLVLTGCAGIGAGTVARDRLDFVTGISESWKRQTLLNLVKTRYADAPVFMDVTSVITQYALEGQLNLAANWVDAPGLDSQSVGGSAKYTDRPTITYSPLMGEKFTKSFMTPIPVPGILFLLQSGYAADGVFRLCVHTVNGIENQFGGPAGRDADPRFFELATAMRKVQQAGGMGMRVTKVDEKSAIVMFFRPGTDPAVAEDLKRIRDLLGVDPGATELHVTYGSHAASGREIAILSRSMLQVSIDLASYIEVPESDAEEGRVYVPKWADAQGPDAPPPLLRIRSSTGRPSDAHVAVPYRGHWFWIDDRDYASKKVLLFYMLLSSLTDTGGQAAAPIVTVPTN